MHKLYNFIFIDIDGCFNKQFSKEKDYLQSDRFGLCQELVDNLKTVLDSVDNCKIVISSSWRKFRTDCFISETSYLSGQYWNCICGCCSGTLLWNAS